MADEHVPLDWLEPMEVALRAMLGQAQDNLGGFIARINNAAQAVDIARAKLPNGKMGPSEFDECIKPLAPIDKIQTCLEGGGLVLALVRDSRQNRVKLVRIVECTAERAVMRELKLSADVSGAVWSEGKDETVLNPAKPILRVMRVARFGA